MFDGVLHREDKTLDDQDKLLMSGGKTEFLVIGTRQQL